MIKNRFCAFFAIFLLALNISKSQVLPVLSIFGGPIVGWNFNTTTNLNNELSKAGFPKVSSNGFFSIGGGGFVDLPGMFKGFYRIGGMGIGFSTNINQRVNESLIKAVSYNFGMGGISLEYVKPIKNFDIIFGALFTTGSLKLDLYQYGIDNGNYNSIFNEFSTNSSSQNITRNFKVRFFSVQPQLSFAFIMKKFLYFKLTSGYLFSFNGTWNVDNDTEVKNFPTGIKANGFVISLGVNVGLFFRD